MMLDLLWLLLPVAAASGWWWAKRETVQHDAQRTKVEYFKGLNYLLNNKPDQAIEVFSRMAEAERDIVETHLTLGNLFRRRGEVDRAIHIHHTLSNRSDLSSQQHNRIILELAEDYMRAGLFDRAENLYRSLVEHSEHTATALNRLVDIYEQEKDWRQAIVHCDQLERMTGQVRKVEAAHYYCELAEEALHQGKHEQTQGFLKQALERDANCVRASMMRGQLALEAQDYQRAISSFRQVERQNPSYINEVIAGLDQCYAALERRSEGLRYLRDMQQRYRSGRLTVAVAEALAQQQNAVQAMHFLEHELKHYPTFLGLRSLVELKLSQTDNPEHLDTLYWASKRILDGVAHYQCDNCGFTGKALYWHCPGCKRWNTVKPLPDMLSHDKA